MTNQVNEKLLEAAKMALSVLDDRGLGQWGTAPFLRDAIAQAEAEITAVEIADAMSDFNYQALAVFIITVNATHFLSAALSKL